MVIKLNVIIVIIGQMIIIQRLVIIVVLNIVLDDIIVKICGQQKHICRFNGSGQRKYMPVMYWKIKFKLFF